MPERSDSENRIYKEGYYNGRRDEHLIHCGWCRQGIECPFKNAKVFFKRDGLGSVPNSRGELDVTSTE